MLSIGDSIGNIRLTEHLGEGGMGEVFAGFDEKLRRGVAIKTLRADRLGFEARARLLREARVLSQLDHPHICRLLEYIEGEPSDVLVLELIQGQTLRRAFAEENQGLREDLRWRVAEQVAEALAVAHGQGIVHRDLKPGNVMITSEEEVKVLDFGLARSAESDPVPGDGETPSSSALASAPARVTASPASNPAPAPSTFVHRTEEGQVLGTWTGMSPEQAQGRAGTPASDMYSFGLLLQELFTGKRPYPTDLPLGRLPVHVAAGDTLPMIHRDRDLVALVEGLKSLEAADRPSADEALRRLRWIRGKGGRHRRLFAGVAAGLLLLAGAAKYTYDLRHERNQALAAQAESEQARSEAEQARSEAEQAMMFMGQLFLLGDPFRGGHELTVRELLELGLERVDSSLPEPRVRTHVRASLGVIYLQWGRHEEAKEVFSKALVDCEEGYGSGTSHMADLLLMIAILNRRMGAYEEAETTYLEISEIYEDLGQEDRVAAVLNNLGVLYTERGQYRKAVEYLARSVAIRERLLPPDDLDLAMTIHNLGKAQAGAGHLVVAEATVRRALGIHEEVLGPDSPAVSRSLKGLTEIFLRVGRFEESRTLAQRALDLDGQALGLDHHETATSIETLGEAHWNLGEAERAEATLLRALEVYRDALGPEHLAVGRVSWRLAVLYLETGRLEDAEDWVARALDVLPPAAGEDHDLVARAQATGAELVSLRGQLEEAIATLSQSLESLHHSLGEGHDDTLEVHLTLAATVLRHGELEQARDLYQGIRGQLEAGLRENPNHQINRLRLARAHLGQGQVEEALGDREAARDQWRQALDLIEALDGESVRQRTAHALVLLRLGRVDEARPIVDGLMAEGWRDTDLLALTLSGG